MLRIGGSLWQLHQNQLKQKERQPLPSEELPRGPRPRHKKAANPTSHRAFAQIDPDKRRKPPPRSNLTRNPISHKACAPMGKANSAPVRKRPDRRCNKPITPTKTNWTFLQIALAKPVRNKPALPNKREPMGVKPNRPNAPVKRGRPKRAPTHNAPRVQMAAKASIADQVEGHRIQRIERTHNASQVVRMALRENEVPRPKKASQTIIAPLPNPKPSDQASSPGLSLWSLVEAWDGLFGN